MNDGINSGVEKNFLANFSYVAVHILWGKGRGRRVKGAVHLSRIG